jgi:hypothetical protein
MKAPSDTAVLDFAVSLVLFSRGPYVVLRNATFLSGNKLNLSN